MATENDDLGLELEDELVTEFVNESLEGLQFAESALLDLEANPGDLESLNAIFRAFHTIKGTSSFLGLDRISNLAHQAETLLDRARSGDIQLVGDDADTAFAAADLLRKLVARVGNGDPEGGLAADVDALLTRLSAPPAVSEDEPADAAPAASEAAVEAAEPAAATPVETAPAPAEAAPAPPTCEPAVDAKAPPAVATSSAGAAAAAAPGEGSIRVSTSRLDTLVNKVGELVITQGMFSQFEEVIDLHAKDLTRTVSQLGKIVRELQDLSLSMRMVPLRPTFQKVSRVMRDISRRSQKKVRFVTEGEDTEIDRNMVEELNDPLVHMVRNAIDHGIETAEERVAAGKDPDGTVTLRAFHTAGSVVIELEDDGRGLDRERILSRAIERGIVSPDRELSDGEVYKLIFAAGLSTAEAVTSVSGRGVGMDVVHRNIEALRGRVDISSTKGHGSRFSVSVPLTLAIIEGLLLRVGEERYIIPTVNVRQAFHASPGQLRTTLARGEMVDYQGAMLPVFRVESLMQRECEPGANNLLVVVEEDGERCALAVSELLGQRQVVIKSLGRWLKRVTGVSGAAILGDGNIGLILDVKGVLALARGESDGVPHDDGARFDDPVLT